MKPKNTFLVRMLALLMGLGAMLGLCSCEQADGDDVHHFYGGQAPQKRVRRIYYHPAPNWATQADAAAACAERVDAESWVNQGACYTPYRNTRVVYPDASCVPPTRYVPQYAYPPPVQCYPQQQRRPVYRQPVQQNCRPTQLRMIQPALKACFNGAVRHCR